MCIQRQQVDNLFVVVTTQEPCAAHQATISRWAKAVMQDASLGQFCVKSSCSAASTSALLMGLPLDMVISKFGWLQSSTFTRFYLCPINNASAPGLPHNPSSTPENVSSPAQKCKINKTTSNNRPSGDRHSFSSVFHNKTPHINHTNRPYHLVNKFRKSHKPVYTPTLFSPAQSTATISKNPVPASDSGVEPQVLSSDYVGDFTVVDFNNDQDTVDVDFSSETQEFTLVNIDTDDAGEPLVSPNVDLTSGCNIDGFISMPSPGKELPHLQVSDIVSLDQHTEENIVDPGILDLAESINNSQKSTLQPMESEEPVFKSPRSFTDAEIVSEAMPNCKRKMKSNDQKCAEASTNKQKECAVASTNKQKEANSPSGNIIPECTAGKLKESVIDNSAEVQVKSQKPAVPRPGKIHKSELKHKTGPGITMIICNVEKAKPQTSE